MNGRHKSDSRERLLLALPILCALTYLPALVMSHLLRAKLLCLLSITSLVCTAYILMFKPIAQPVSTNRNQLAQQLESQSTFRIRFLNYLNGGLSVLIFLSSAALKEEKGVHEGFWLLCTLPARKSMKISAASLMLKIISHSYLLGYHGWKAKSARYRPHRAGKSKIRI